MNLSHVLQGWTTRLAMIGQLRHRLTLEAVQSVPDGAGGVQKSFAPLTTLWAAIRPIGGETATAPHQTGETLTHEITLRYRSDVTVGMRFRQAGGSYVIRLVADPDRRKMRLVCLCTQDRA